MSQAKKRATMSLQFKIPESCSPSEMLTTWLWKYSSAGEMREEFPSEGKTELRLQNDSDETLDDGVDVI